VHITYDVEVGDAIQLKELPFVVGVLSDLSGRPDEALPPLKDRKFVEIDRDNFDAV
jgi:type VI secretion system protein ImpB